MTNNILADGGDQPIGERRLMDGIRPLDGQQRLLTDGSGRLFRGRQLASWQTTAALGGQRRSDCGGYQHLANDSNLGREWRLFEDDNNQPLGGRRRSNTMYLRGQQISAFLSEDGGDLTAFDLSRSQCWCSTPNCSSPLIPGSSAIRN